MRVITGTARGSRLKTLDGLEVRPTAERVKEAVFSSIHFEVEGARVLDLFCGSGQMGIEALSRGAQFCIFVDSSREAQEIAKENLSHTNLLKQARVAAMDAFAFLQSTKDMFDIVFLDPPYSKGLVQQALPMIAEKMSDAGVILAEHELTDKLPETAGDFTKVKEYKYGRILITAYRKITE